MGLHIRHGLCKCSPSILFNLIIGNKDMFYIYQTRNIDNIDRQLWLQSIQFNVPLPQRNILIKKMFNSRYNSLAMSVHRRMQVQDEYVCTQGFGINAPILQYLLCSSVLMKYIVWRQSLKIPRGVIRGRKAKKDRQHNGQEEKDKGQTIHRTLHRTQNTALKPQNWTTRLSLKTEGELRCFRRISSSCSTSGARRVTLITSQVTSYERGQDRIVITINGSYTWSFVTRILRNG